MAMIADKHSLTWGRIVKSWATGLDYLATPPAQQPPPAGAKIAGKAWALPPLQPVNFQATVNGSAVQKTIPGVLYLTMQECTALLNKAGIPTVDPSGNLNITYPPATTDVIIVQGNANTMVLRLPPKAVLQASEQNLLNGGPYPTPTFYNALYSPPNGPVISPAAPTTQAGIMDLHANRIGDYTMGLCA